MSSFKIEYDAQAFEKSRSGAIWGPVWVILGDEAFPEANWNDMPVALLNEFIRAGRQLQKSQSETVRFFDGPFSVTLKQITSDSIEISLGGSRVRASVIGTVASTEFIASLRGTANAMYLSCVEHGWSEDDDVRRLMQSIQP